MRLYRVLKKVKSLFIQSDSRKIKSVDIGTRRIAAMTFDDGPCGLACPDGRALTDFICDTLAKYGFTATFNIIGTTAENYPDHPGKGFLWSGTRFDHYPRFDDDTFGGAVNNPDIIKRLIACGNELANHGYRHVVCGKVHYPYHQRSYFKTTDEVIADYKRLHSFIYNSFGYTMTGARPPHYCDKINDGGNIFDIYLQLNYNYYAASFDAGGWSNDDTSEAMVNNFKQLLKRDPDALCGAIIYQKDGLSMNGEMLIYEALPKQLKLLLEYGYKIISVKELLDIKNNKNID